MIAVAAIPPARPGRVMHVTVVRCTESVGRWDLRSLALLLCRKPAITFMLSSYMLSSYYQHDHVMQPVTW